MRRQMRITKRGINSKRHTVGYLVGGKWRTRNETVRLAQQGRVHGVVVRNNGPYQRYVASIPSPYADNLYDLPVRIGRDINDIRRSH